MKTNNKLIKLSFSLAALLAAQTGFAGGTEAGTKVENTATLSYSIGGSPQADIVSSVSDFLVDNKVDLNVTGNSATNVIVNPSTARNTTANKLSYTLTNQGNFEQNFKIGVTHLGTDNFDAGTAPTTAGPQVAQACQYLITPTTVPATPQTGPHNLADAPVVKLGIDESALIEVMCSMPNRPDVSDGHLSTIDVLATAVDGAGVTMAETGGVDNEDSIDIVLADDTGTATDGGNRNAKHSVTQTFEIDTPELSIVKSSRVVEDPLNSTTNPKRIPGAIIEYTITIQNTSDSPATGVTVTDLLTAVVDGEVQFNTGTPILNSGGGSGSYTASTKTVTVTGMTVPAGTITTPGEVTVTFEVEIL